MNDTVARIMDLADAYRAQPYPFQVEARQALEDELTRLFTPLTDEQIERVDRIWINYTSFEEFEIHQPSVFDFARAVEAAHGITGEKNETNAK